MSLTAKEKERVAQLVRLIGPNIEEVARRVSSEDVTPVALLTERLKQDSKSLSERVTQIEADVALGKRVTVELPDGKKHKVDGAHKDFAKALHWVTQGCNLMLVGPAGTGKTHMAKQLADAVGKRFHMQPVNEQLYPSKLFGQKYADGTWHKTAFWKAYTGLLDHPLFGGDTVKADMATLMCFDELDRIMPNTGCALNAALSGDFAEFCDCMWDKDPEFGVIATANTFGDGMSTKYTGANNLDKSLMNRFVLLHIDYDCDLEKHVYGDSAWLRYCQAIRDCCVTNNIPVDISMRQVDQGLRGLDKGKYPGKVEELMRDVVWNRFQPKAQEDRVRSLMQSKHGAGWNSLEFWGETMGAEKDKKMKRQKKQAPPDQVDEVQEFSGSTEDILAKLLAEAKA